MCVLEKREEGKVGGAEWREREGGMKTGKKKRGRKPDRKESVPRDQIGSEVINAARHSSIDGCKDKKMCKDN